MAKGEFIMNKVNEELVDSIEIDLSPAQARARLKLWMATHTRPSRAVGGSSREWHSIIDTDFEITPGLILGTRFFSKSAWGMPSMSKERDNGQVITTPGGLNQPLVTGATFADYTALLFKACGMDYHPYIGVKTDEDLKKVERRMTYGKTEKHP